LLLRVLLCYILKKLIKYLEYAIDTFFYMIVRLHVMKQHVELAIIIAMSAMMVFGAAAFVMPYVYAASSSGGSSTPGASGAAATGSKGGAGGKGTNPGSSSSTGGSSTGSSSPPPKNPPPKNPPPKPCVPGKCVGDPGYYTTNGHHHCFDGAPGCKCTDPHKCTVGSALIRPDSIMTTV
jgi:hypothetical protein